MEFNIDQPTQKFTNHLSVPFNDRIIFSGPFGTGKTYFLEKYFENNPNYNVIHLFPVNYSVASNEDIFELIKYDVLFELLGKEVDFDKIEISHLEFFKKFALRNAHHILAPFLNFLPEIGKSVHTVYEKLQALGEKYFVEYEGANTDDKQAVIDYLGNFTKTKGSIFEEDFYTQLICQSIEQLKIELETDKKCETVLIIDDLDRIDPEHIFRILNVLSAHMDAKGESGNKFNFDKIILVFDQQNVHKIFQNRYGSNVDFSGYIDKFYSHKIFEFENIEGVNQKILEFLQNIEIPKSDKFSDFHSPSNVLSQNVQYIFSGLVKAKQITIRRLKKVLGKKFLRIKYNPRFGNNQQRFLNSQLEICLIFEFLFMFYGSWDEIIDALEKSNDFDYNNDSLYRFLSFALTALDSDQHKFKIQNEKMSFNHQKTNQYIEYNTLRSGEYQTSFLAGVYLVSTFENKTEESIPVKYFPILTDTAKKLKEWDSIRI